MVELAPDDELWLFNSVFSSSTIVEAEPQELFCSDLKLPHKTTKTLELEPGPRALLSSEERRKEKPVFLSELRPVVAAPGERVMFSVSVSGWAQTVHWFHRGHRVTASDTYTLSHDRDTFSLVISSVHRDLAGEYSCSVNNRYGSATCSSYLQVALEEPEPERRIDKHIFESSGKAPEFTSPTESVQLREGADAFFRFVVAGDPVPEVQWFRGASALQPSSCCIMVLQPDGSGFLNLRSVQLQHSGHYTCRASNLHGYASCSSDLLVLRDQVQEELEKQPRGFKISELSSESRSQQERMDQMIYTIGCEARQVIPSEEVGTLGALEVSAARLQREQLPQAAAVLQQQQLQETLCSSPAPAALSVVPVKQLLVTSFLSSVQEKPEVSEQQPQRVLSPELVELQASREQQQLLSATSQHVCLLSSVSDQASTNWNLEQLSTETEPRHLLRGLQVETMLQLQADTSGGDLRPETQRGFHVREGVKLLHSAESWAQQPLTETHCELLPELQAASEPRLQTQQLQRVAPVTEATVALSKEQLLQTLRPQQQKLRPLKEDLHKFAPTTEEKFKVQAEQLEAVPEVSPPEVLQPRPERGRELRLQLITEQDVLQAEGRFSSQMPDAVQLLARCSPPLHQSATQQQQTSAVCEATSELSDEAAAASAHITTESPQRRLVQSCLLPLVLPKEGSFSAAAAAEQAAAETQPVAWKHAAASGQLLSFTAEASRILEAAQTEQLQQRAEPQPLSSLSVSSLPLQLSKETLLSCSPKQQQLPLAQLQLQQQQRKLAQPLSVSHTLTMEQSLSLRAEQTHQPELQTEPQLLKHSAFIEEQAAAAELCLELEAAEQDSAEQIQEGQTLRRCLTLQQQQPVLAEQACDLRQAQSSLGRVQMEPQAARFAPQSQESPTLPQGLSFKIHIPKPSRLKLQQQLRAALHCAQATEQQLLLADVLGTVESLDLQEVTLQREPSLLRYTYLITSHMLLELTLSLGGDVPQRAELRDELQTLLHTMVAQQHQSLASELLVPVVAESAAESLAAAHQSAVESSVQTPVLQAQCEEPLRPEAAAPAEHRASKEEFLSDAVMIGESCDSVSDLPVVAEPLVHVIAEENTPAALTASIKHVSRVDWFHDGRLVKPGREFKCCRDHDTFTLVIDRVLKQHQGEFVCEAENEAGRTTTSSTLTVLCRGLMMKTSLYHHQLTSHMMQLQLPENLKHRSNSAVSHFNALKNKTKICFVKQILVV